MNPKRLFVLALDGVSYTLLQDLIQRRIMPNLETLIKQGRFAQMDSVQPPVSSSAWASFITGLKPGQNGILGFVDRNPATLEWYVPLADRLKGATLWQKLSKAGKRVFVMNVPMTYPPPPLNGISICGFLGTDILKGTFPPGEGVKLKADGYRIDADTSLAADDLFAFYEDLMRVLDKRLATMWRFWQQEPWDFFMTHIMETDRLHHFFWEQYRKDEQPFLDMFLEFYRRLDRLIGNMMALLAGDIGLLMLSDHGFTTLEKEVYLNRWLLDKRFLSFNTPAPQSLQDMTRSSFAYSLYPGRIYLNVKGREQNGRVSSLIEYEQIRSEITNKLLSFKDEENKRPVIREVVKGEELFGNVDNAFSGYDFDNVRHSPYPDLLAVPEEGYDLKGNLASDSLFKKQHFTGMHTFHDAFLLGKNIPFPGERSSIDGCHNLVLDFYKV